MPRRPGPAGRGPRPRPGFALAVLAAYTALAVLMFWSTWGSGGVRWIGVNGDPQDTIWSLAWNAQALVHLRNPFLTDAVFYPRGIDLLWGNADDPTALGFAAAPLTLLAGPVLSYNVLQTLALALSAFAAFLAFRRFVTRPAAAAVGGLVYGFGPYMVGQSYGHLGLTFAVTPPLLLLLLDHLLTGSRFRAPVLGLLIGLAGALQFYISEEVLATEAVMGALLLAWAAAVALAERARADLATLARRVAAGLGLGAAVTAALVAYPVHLLFTAVGRVTHEPVRAFGSFSADLYGFWIPAGPNQLLSNAWTQRLSASFPGNPVESGSYLGVGLLAVLAVTLMVWWRRPRVLFTVGAAALAGLLSLGPVLVHGGHASAHVHLPWDLLSGTPVLNEILNARFSLYTDLFAGLALAMFVDLAWATGRTATRIGASALAAISLALLLPAASWPSTLARTPALFTDGGLAALLPEGGVALTLPANLPPRAWTGEGGYAVLWQAQCGICFKTPFGDLLHGNAQGFASNMPEPSALWAAVQALQGGGAPDTSPPALQAVRDELAADGARLVVVGPMAARGQAVGYFSELLGRPPEELGGGFLWRLG